MSAPLVPSPLDYIGRRSFGFYPPIRRAGPNSWLLGASSWSEVQIFNAETGSELWLPRQYIGAVGDQQNALTVGLTQYVELRGHSIVPSSDRRVIMMPLRRESLSHSRYVEPGRVIGIRLENENQRTFHNAPFRVSVCVLFVTGLLALVATASR
jgi:hypothetical protein